MTKERSSEFARDCMQWSTSKCLITLYKKRGRKVLPAFVNFYGINIPIMADFKLPM